MGANADRWWEWAGTAMAGVGWIAIAAQLADEWQRQGPSPLSPAYAQGFLLVFLFWTAYGWHYRRPAVWIGNLVASVLQVGLVVGVYLRG